MKTEKNGFISISVVYSFFLVFIAIVLSILAAYSSRRYMLIGLKEDIRNVIDGKTTYSCFSKGITRLNDCLLDVYGGKDYIESQDDPDFNLSPADGEYGMYASDDNIGTSYYFRGDVDNNYVQFGQDDEGNDMYWRVVRINGDGTIRLIYDTTKNSACEESNNASICIIEDYAYNYNYCLEGVCNYIDVNSFTATDNWKYNSAYINYDGSIAKQLLELWYENHLADYYSKIVVPNYYCNDREFNDYADPDYPGNKLYKSYDRLAVAQKGPTLKCSQESDKLELNIGLITADEVAMAGGVFGKENKNFYLAYEKSYWTMTAYDNSALSLTENNSQWGDADLWFVQSEGILNNTDSALNNSLALRPVINLKADVEIKKGNGTSSSPYVLEEEGY